MIRFFRSIRQKLLHENRLTRYLIYAVGEIILVVVGILLALQINNYSEQQKLRKKEALLLTEMRSNLQGDLLDLKYNVRGNKSRMDKNKVLISVMEQKLPYNDSLRDYFGKYFGNFQLVENTAAWENLKSVGIDLISNDSLRNKVSYVYANKYIYLENVEKGLDDRYQWDHLYPQMLAHINLDKLWGEGVPRDYETWLNDDKFYETLKLNVSVRNYMQVLYEDNSELVEELIKDIEQHLEELGEVN